MAEQWRIELDRDTCMGSGVCLGTAPNHFVFVDGRATPTTELVDQDPAVVDAAESCPMEAILIRAVDSGAVIAPEQ